MVQGAAGIALASLTGPAVQAAPVALADLAANLSRIGLLAGLLLLVVVLVWVWRAATARGSPAPRSATWACGYAAVSARMQTTGAGFSADFAERFRGVLRLVRRQKAPQGYFPADAWLVTDCVDAVEHRLFDVIRHGDASASALSQKLREDDPRYAFAAGLVALVAIAALVLLVGGPLL
jgi:hydrogenase-4 component B